MIKIIKKSDAEYEFDKVQVMCCDCAAGDADSCGFGE